MNKGITQLLARKDKVLHEGRLGLLCNQVAFDQESGAYLHEVLAQRGNLARVFVPEHGLFAELQDQVPLPDAGIYQQQDSLDNPVEFVSLYGGTPESLRVQQDKIQDLDALIVALQDVGSRYYTFAITLSYLLDHLAETGNQLQVYIIDYENPAGRWVEGTRLPAAFTSFIGREGMIHRHGMTLGELCGFWQARSGGRYGLQVIPLDQPAVARLNADQPQMPIPPSPNMPLIETTRVYGGQCLLEGTNISEGRGTTRPFEIFGAPWFDRLQKAGKDHYAIRTRGVVMRPLQFLPAFHKYANETCHGYQIHQTGEGFHSLAVSLQLIAGIAERCAGDFHFLKGPYELMSRRPAIELMAGDSLILDYLKGQATFSSVCEALSEAQSEWITTMQPYLIYDTPFRQIPPAQNLLSWE